MISNKTWLNKGSLCILISDILDDARHIIENTCAKAVRSVDFCRVQMYWKRIFEEEQHGKERADYGAYIIRNPAACFEAEYGSGFGVRQLERARQFYKLYPIATAMQSQLNWSQYRMFCSCPLLKDILLSGYILLTEMFDDNENSTSKQAKVFPAVQGRIIGPSRTTWSCSSSQVIGASWKPTVQMEEKCSSFTR